MTIPRSLRAAAVSSVRTLLRELVWSAEGLTSFETLRVDSLDLSAHHVVAFDDALLVASSQVSLHNGVSSMRDGAHYESMLWEGTFPAAVFNRMVVRPSHGKRGLAAAMDERRLAMATRWGVRTVLTEVRDLRVAAMKELGFTVLGDSPDLRYPGAWSIMAKSMVPSVRWDSNVGHEVVERSGRPDVNT